MPLNIGGNEIVKMRANQIVNTNPVFSNLLLNFDAGIVSSYAGSGTTWTDLSGNGYNATLINGPTYSTSGGGSIAFDGSNERTTGRLYWCPRTLQRIASFVFGDS
jgi:hypothetical protein